MAAVNPMNVYVLVVTMILTAIGANILLKLGAIASEPLGLAGLLNWYVLVGLAMFGLAALLYLIVLRRLPLNVTQAFIATQFVGVLLASHFILGEAIPPLRIAGCALIVSGVVLIGFSQT